MFNFTSNNHLVIDEANDSLLDYDDFRNDIDFTEESLSLNESITVSFDEVVPELDFSFTSLEGDESLIEEEPLDREPSFGSVDTEVTALPNFLSQQLLDNKTDSFSSDGAFAETYSSEIFTSNNLANFAIAPANSSIDFNYLEGTLEADSFIYTPEGGGETVVISGNGNLNYGDGYYDSLDLSQISVSQVSDYSFAEIGSGGALIDTGNGDRVFDYITLDNGDRFFFEGIDRVVFSDDEFDLAVDPDDTGYLDQWNLHMMGVQNAWRFTTGSEDVLVGVQDTGLGVDGYGDFHPDLDNTIYYPDNVADEFYREVPGDDGPKDSSHGTAVQGIIGAATDNGIGIAGINWDSGVFNIDVLDGNTGDLSLAEATQRMIDYANSEGQRLVINMSLGGASIDPAFETLVADNQDNVLFVIASGNSGHLGEEGISSPAILAQDYDNVMAVGASWGASDYYGSDTIPGTRIEYYDWWGSQYGEGLTLMGPSEVWTTDASPDSGFDYNSQFNGTSAATPNVSGVASLVWSANNNLDATQIKEILSDTAYDLGDEGYDIFYGHGFVNADAAVRRAIALSYDDSSTDTSSNSVSASDSFTGSNDDNQVTEDSFLFPQQALDDPAIELVSDPTINFGASDPYERMTGFQNYPLEGFEADSTFSNSWSEEQIFYNEIEV